MDMQASAFADTSAALEWAKERFAFDEAQPVRGYPWALLFKLERGEERAWLKLLPMNAPRVARINAVISDHFRSTVPETLAINEELCLQLIRHHDGVELDTNPNEAQRCEMLRTYARLQAKAADLPAITSTLPALDPDTVFDRFLDFLEPGDDATGGAPSTGDDFTVKADFYLGSDAAAEYHGTFLARRELFTELLAEASVLPGTLNHGDLRLGNAAEADDGSIILYDWDDALFGPAGLSLQAFFLGCFRPLQFLRSEHSRYVDFARGADQVQSPEFVAAQEELFAAEKRVLNAYVAELVAQGYAPEADIRRALPAAVCAGAMQALMNYGEHAVDDENYRLGVNEFFVKRLDDLLNLADYLSCASRERALRFATDYAERDILFRAAYIYRYYVNAHPNDLDMQRRLVDVLDRGGKLEEAAGWCSAILDEEPADVDSLDRLGQLLLRLGRPEEAIVKFRIALSIDDAHESALANLERTGEVLDMILEATRPDKLPPVRISASERERGALFPEKTATARQLFERHGALTLEHVFDTDMLAEIKQLILDKYDNYFEPRQYDDCLRLGDKRHMVTLDIEGPLASPTLYDNPYIAPIVSGVLGDDYILGAINIGVSLPGAQNQSIHKDYPPLFPESEEFRYNTPCFAAAVLIPLVQHSNTVGTTLVVKDSHRISHAEAQALPAQGPFLDVGGALMIDYRVSHQGLANTSEDVVRPLLTLIYHRCWFRDCVNYVKQVPVQIDRAAFESSPERLKELIGWAMSESIISTEAADG